MTDFIPYKKSRFSTRLPKDRFYTPSHFWMKEESPGSYRVGLTKFAIRMLGDLVEAGFEVKPDESVRPGDIIGWVEGLKAATDLFCVMDGAFVTGNDPLNDNPEWFNKSPYEKAWLYEVKGTVEPRSFDAEGYAAYLDETIDKMLGDSAQ